MNGAEPKVREAAWDGQFYPANPLTLERMIQRFLDVAPKSTHEGEIVGIVAPHAGYEYSGRTAAAAYKQILGQSYRSVIVVAPSHADMFAGASIYDGDYYGTPLGKVAIDKELSAAISNFSPLLRLSERGHHDLGGRAEHSLEVHLPFLQSVLRSGFRLVAIVLHDYSSANCQILADALASAIADQNVLMIASSDLYHGYSPEKCKEVDDRTLQSIESFDPQEFLRGANEDLYHACGAGPIAAMLMAAKKNGATKAKVIAQTNSAEATGQKSGWTVGYASVLVTRPFQEKKDFSEEESATKVTQ